MSTITFKQQEEETKIFWQAIADRTKSLIRLAFAIYKEGNKIDQLFFLNRNQPLPSIDAFSLLKKENAWFKNDKVQKSTLWKFAENQTYNIVIIDDIQAVQQFKDRDHFLLWQTSEGKFQAAFLLDRYLETEDIKKIQRALIDVYGGDKASLGASHYVRVPGFLNTKYLNNPPLVKLCYVGNNVLSTEQVLRYYKYNIEPKESKLNKDLKSLSKLLTYKELKEKKKDWLYFYNLKGDKSSADFAYALYLLHFNLTDEEIKQTLIAESDDIENRKKGHLEDYLNRTISKARLHFKPFEEQEN
jgi:hypothetical protein